MSRVEKHTKHTRKRITGKVLGKRRLEELIEEAIVILNLPLPSRPPAGWEWIEAYRHWARGGR